MSVKSEVSIGVVARALSYLFYTLLIPQYVNFFDGDLVRSGTWMVVTGLVNWLLVLDFGIGNGLRNRLLKLKAYNNRRFWNPTILSAYLANILVALILLIVSIVALNFYAIHFYLEHDLKQALFVIIAFICLQMITRTIIFVYYAEGKAYMGAIFNMVTNMLMLISLELLSEEKGKVQILAFTYGILINFPLALAVTLKFLFSTKNNHQGNMHAFNLHYLKKNVIYLSKQGGGFFVSQILFLAVIQVNPVIIAWVYGNDKVVGYTALSAIFFVPVILANIVGNPVWSRVAFLFQRRDGCSIIQWQNKTFVMASMLAIIDLAIAYFFMDILMIWMPNIESNLIDQNMVNVFCIYGIALIFQSMASAFACALGNLRLQRIFYFILLAYKFAFIFFVPKGFIETWVYFLVIDIVLLVFYSLMQAAVVRRVARAVMV